MKTVKPEQQRAIDKWERETIGEVQYLARSIFDDEASNSEHQESVAKINRLLGKMLARAAEYRE